MKRLLNFLAISILILIARYSLNKVVDETLLRYSALSLIMLGFFITVKKPLKKTFTDTGVILVSVILTLMLGIVLALVL